MMLDLRLAVVDDKGSKNPVLAFVDNEGEIVTRIGPLPRRANLVRQWLDEAYRCMDQAGSGQNITVRTAGPPTAWVTGPSQADG